MDLIRSIKSAEQHYKRILEGYFISVFDDSRLPSHGLDHHRRVWNNARELLESMHGHHLQVTTKLIESLIIASYLHDSGMAADPGPKHGHLSAEMCRQFLEKHSLDESLFPGLIEAIENHDNKDYTRTQELNLQSLLSIADDLDAFGYTGIYRYLEIYGLRGTAPELIAGKIRKNAASRYKHFEMQFLFDESLVSRHRKRFEVLDTFFKEQEEKNSPSFKTIRNIIYGSLSSNSDLKSTLKESLSNPDKDVAMFFFNLESDLSV